MMPINDRKLREQMCSIGNRLWQRGLIAAFDGNLSLRIDEHAILCTPTGLSKGFLVPDDLVIIDEEGTVLQGEHRPSSEIKMHLEIYEKRADVNAVVHAHPPHATGFAVAGQEIPAGVMPEIDFFLGKISLLPYAPPGSRELAEGFVEPLLEGTNVFLLSNHGATTVGLGLEEAWFRMESLEQCCQVLKVAKQIGEWRVIG